MKIRKGDTVKVLYGKDSGKTGVVAKVFPKKNAVVVEGINLATKHFKKRTDANGKEIPAAVAKVALPMDVSKVIFFDTEAGKTSRKPVRKAVAKAEKATKKAEAKSEEVKKTTKKTEKKSEKAK